MITKKHIKNGCKSLFVANFQIVTGWYSFAILPTVEFVKRIQHYERIYKFLCRDNPDFMYLSASMSVFYLNRPLIDTKYDYGFTTDNALFTIDDYKNLKRDMEFMFTKEGFYIKFLIMGTSVLIPYNTFRL